MVAAAALAAVAVTGGVLLAVNGDDELLSLDGHLDISGDLRLRGRVDAVNDASGQIRVSALAGEPMPTAIRDGVLEPVSSTNLGTVAALSGSSPDVIIPSGRIVFADPKGRRAVYYTTTNATVTMQTNTLASNQSAYVFARLNPNNGSIYFGSALLSGGVPGDAVVIARVTRRPNSAPVLAGDITWVSTFATDRGAYSWINGDLPLNPALGDTYVWRPTRNMNGYPVTIGWTMQWNGNQWMSLGGGEFSQHRSATFGWTYSTSSPAYDADQYVPHSGSWEMMVVARYGLNIGMFMQNAVEQYAAGAWGPVKYITGHNPIGIDMNIDQTHFHKFITLGSGSASTNRYRLMMARVGGNSFQAMVEMTTYIRPILLPQAAR